MKRVYLGTMLFVYWFDRASPHFEAADAVFKKVAALGYVLVSSLFVQGELLVHPIRHDDRFAAARIQKLFQAQTLQLVPFDAAAMQIYAKLCAETPAKPLDALHLACAARAGVDLFVTNDTKLYALQIPRIGRVIGLDADLLSTCCRSYSKRNPTIPSVAKCTSAAVPALAIVLPVQLPVVIHWPA